MAKKKVAPKKKKRHAHTKGKPFPAPRTDVREALKNDPNMSYKELTALGIDIAAQSFYAIRSSMRQKGQLPQSPPGKPGRTKAKKGDEARIPHTQHWSDASVSELLKVAEFAQEMGGIERLEGLLGMVKMFGSAVN